MFEANHQCISQHTLYFKDGSTETDIRESIDARRRCDPYRAWFKFQSSCANGTLVDRIEWQFDHSINGGPFYRIVDEQDVCSLEYKAFGRNEWIKTPEEGATIIGYPVKNVYY